MAIAVTRHGDDINGVSTRRRDRAFLMLFGAMVVSLTLFQKIGFGSADDPIAVALPVMLVCVGAAFFFAKPHLSPVRAALFFAFLAAAALSTMTQNGGYSFKSLLLLLVLYVPYLISFPVSNAGWRRMLDVFSTTMVVAAAIVLVQDVVQLVDSWRSWPNLDQIVPSNMLVAGYIYIQPITRILPYMKPNGIFFLEVSFVSQFTAIALAIEIVFLKRAWRIALFSVVMFACFAGTGLLLLALSLPVLLARISVKRMAIIVLALFVLWIVVNQLGWFQIIAPRLGEYQRYGSSANHRFIEPAIRLIAFGDTPGALFRGIGPGNIERATGFLWWPITKASVEYGYLAGALFYAFFLYTLFDSAPSRRLAFMLAIWFSIMAGLAVPANTVTCMMLCTLFRVESTSARRKSRSSNGSSTPPAGPAASEPAYG
jgi:hypothetical protein